MRKVLAIGVLKEVLNATVSETEELLEKLKAEVARPRKVLVKKWIKRRPIHGASYQFFKKFTAEVLIEHYFKC